MKLRYFDTPFFIDVAQIVSGYAVGEQVTPTIGVNQSYFPKATFADRLIGSLAVQQSYVDRPTVSYAPQTRPDFIRNLTVPLPPTSVLYLMQTGYPVDLVIDLTLDAINGIQGRTVSGGQVRPASPEYQRVVEILRMAQLSGSVGTLCAVMLLMASDTDPLFLQVKQARPSVLEPYAGKSLHANHGQRVVMGCHLMQSASDLFLGWTEGQAGRHFYIRQLKDMKIKPLVEVFTPSVMLRLRRALWLDVGPRPCPVRRAGQDQPATWARATSLTRRSPTSPSPMPTRASATTMPS